MAHLRAPCRNVIVVLVPKLVHRWARESASGVVVVVVVDEHTATQRTQWCDAFSHMDICVQ